MDDSLMIDVAGVRMYGRPGHSPYGVVEDGLEGWDDGVDMRSERLDRAQAHGSYSMPGFGDSRTVSIRGVILGKSGRDLQVAKDRLTGLLADGRIGRVQVTLNGHAQWADGYLSSKTKVIRRRGTYNADFQISLWFPDPRKFGDLNEFVARVGENGTLFHRGNYDAPPRFVVSGSAPDGYVLMLGGKRFNVTARLITTAPHTIDFDDGRLRVGGAIVHGGLGQTATPHVPPGITMTLSVAPLSTGTPVARVALLDTYI